LPVSGAKALLALGIARAHELLAGPEGPASLPVEDPFSTLCSAGEPCAGALPDTARTVIAAAYSTFFQ